MKRQHIPRSVETEVLRKARRRCALCFHLAPEDLAAAVRPNRFSAVGQEPMMRTGGWRVLVPRGSSILFSQHEGDSLIAPTGVVEYRNPSLIGAARARDRPRFDARLGRRLAVLFYVLSRPIRKRPRVFNPVGGAGRDSADERVVAPLHTIRG